MEISDFQLNTTLEGVDYENLDIEDKEFLKWQSDLEKNNIHELRAILGGLINQKNKRLPFKALSLSDLSDLDYHKDKDAWDHYYSIKSLYYALQTPNSYGFQESTKHIQGLEKRYNHYLQESNNHRAISTQPAKTGRNKEVTILLEELEIKGYKTIGQIDIAIANLDIEIESLKKQIEQSLKIPIVDVSVEYSSLAWSIPLSMLLILMFLYFYVSKASSVVKQFLTQTNSHLTSYPWILLTDKKLSKGAYLVGIILKSTLLCVPLIVEITAIYLGKDLNYLEWILSISFVLASLWITILIIGELNETKKVYNKTYKQ